MTDVSMNLKKILFATDFSDLSNDAMAMAVILRDKIGCSIEIVHVFDQSSFEMPAPYYFMAGANHWLDEHLSELRKRGQTALEKLSEQLGGCRAYFEEGKPGKNIVAAAERNHCDLIVLGTHGHRGWNRLTLGSVAEYVVRHAHCAVMTVKPKNAS
jgi:nucleotide-binding universal stress UspA family protein